MAASDVDLTFDEYKAEIVKADNERLAQAGWLAMCELQHELAKISSYRDEVKWCLRVNQLAEEIYRRPS